MLKLIRREASYVEGYKAYCKEFHDNDIQTFRPTNPKLIDDGWFEQTKDWYQKKKRAFLRDFQNLITTGLSMVISL